MKDFLSICKQAQLHKKSAALLTPEAEAAAVPPQDPNAMGGMPPQGGMPMDPAMMGGQPPMDPNTGMPINPSMMGGMTPQSGAPMDPSMMQGGMPQVAPMPQDQAGAWMQDQGFIQFLMQMGVQFDQQGNAIDPNGKLIDPAMLDQLYAQYQQQMAQGAPMDSAMMQGGAPMDPAMMGGDPNAMGGMPMEQGTMDPAMMQDQGMSQDMMNNMASIIMDSVDSVIDQRMAALDKKISAFADKLDSIKSMLDDLALGTDEAAKKQQIDNDRLNAQLESDLRNTQQPQQQQLAGTQDMMKSASVQEVKAVRSILDIMRG